MIKKIMRINSNFLDLLIEEHKAGKIDFDIFKSYSEIKLQFLKNNIDNIYEHKLKASIENTIKTCEEIFNKINAEENSQ